MSSPAKPEVGKPSGRKRRARKVLQQPEPTEKLSRPFWRTWWFALALVAWGLLIYLPALGGQFVFDDLDLAETASTVRTGRLKPIIESGRPLLMLSYILNHRLGGFQPFPFHLVNVLLHCLNAVLIWRFLIALIKTGSLDGLIPERFREFMIYAIPALFLTSPIQTESVAYISSRSEALATTFFVLALWVFASPLRSRSPWKTAFLVVFLFVCSVGSKQDRMVLPAVILLLDYLLLARCDWRKLKENWPTYGLFVVGGIGGFFVVVKPFLFAPSAGFLLDWQTYLFTQFRMYFLYARLILVPFGLNVDHHIIPSRSLGDELSWLALLLLIAIFGMVLYRHKRMPVISFGVLFFLGVIAPTSSFFPILDYAAERRLYLPVLGLMIAATAFTARYWRPRIEWANAGLIAILAVYSVGTYQRSAVWADSIKLWTDTAKKSPGKARPLVWLGKVYNDRGRYQRANSVWRKAEEVVEPNSGEHAHLLSNLGLAAANLKDHEKAAGYYERAVEMQPSAAQFWAHLAVAQLRLGLESEGWKSFDEAAKRARGRPGVFQLRGQEYFRRKQYRQAAQDFRLALEMSPEDAVIRRNLEAAEEMLRQTQR